MVDVYLAKKKDASGSNFAFIRFKGVGDTIALERNLGSVMYNNSILKCNVDRYMRNSKMEFASNDSSRTQVRHSISKPDKGWINKRRSFVDVVKGEKNNTVIHLDAQAAGTDRFSKKALVGEVHSIEHLRNLPLILDAYGMEDIKVYYLGGLIVML